MGREGQSAGMFFFGVFLTGFSSSYYHWNPNDAGLFWDRLPMALAFMAILSNVVEERIGTMLVRAAKLGLDLQAHIKTGLVALRQVDPAQIDLAEWWDGQAARPASLMQLNASSVPLC